MKFYRPIAALTMFTKLPLWRWFRNIPVEAYSHAVTWWPFVGIIVCGFSAAVYFLLAMVLPPLPAAIITIVIELLISGAYHEDGLADFFDGFGGGSTREQILAIMKDSHIGTYGVIALMMYFMTEIGTVSALPPKVGAILFLCAGPWARFCAGLVTSFLPYARANTGAKNSATYVKPSVADRIFSGLCGILPSVIVLILIPSLWESFIYALGLSAAVAINLMFYLSNKIKGYTGDCCGALCLITQVTYFVVFTFLFFINPWYSI
jgi:adenosylcobinamide-GDP ribazoletransferase